MIRRRLWFVGVSTSGSRAIGLFPRWCAALGIEAELVPVDLPLGAPAEAYRRLVANLGADQEAVGAVVTTHKVALFEAAAERFASRDRSVDLFEEIACVTAGDGGLSANTIDPRSVARALTEMLPRTVDEASALVLGAGGAGTAVAAALLMDQTAPWTVTLTDAVDGRLARAERILSGLSVRNRAVLVRASGSEDNDGALAEAPPGSLVVNATGMGKDVPGSPVSGSVSFPEHGLVWDLNYRGELLFLDQARAQAGHRGLRVEDGGRLFVHGWADGLGQIFGRKVPVETLEQSVRPGQR
jgi:shikimate 5-dehydrogenase